MRILVVTNMYPSTPRPHYGTFVHEQVESLRAAGVEVDVQFIDGATSRQNYLRAVGEVRARVREGNYDLVHAHYALSAAVARTQHTRPLVVTFHGSEVATSFTAPLSRYLAGRVDGVIVTSQRVKADLGFDAAVVIPCGVDLDLFKPVPLVEARRRLGLPLDRKYVLFAGRRAADKRIPVLEEAVRRTQRVDPNVELLIVSGRPLYEVPLYMNACDVFALISDYEGSPQVIKEAMACNLPLVSCDVGDVIDVIDGTPGCYVCRNKTAEDVAVHILRALDFGGRTDGRQAVGSYGMPAIAERLVTYYDALLTRLGQPVRWPARGKAVIASASQADTAEQRSAISPERTTREGSDRVISD